MGTIPIYWGEVDGGLEALISGAVDPHWARAQLERQFELWPLDYLTAQALAPFKLLLMAQPRGLTPEENVALDNWVRTGGRLLLLADPVMTGHSHYPLGDRRRPQDTALLSPILAHWGLEMLFDADQAHGLEVREYVGGGGAMRIPAALPGRLSKRDSDARCTLYADEIMAFCSIGEGRVVILADAAILDHEGPWPGAKVALEELQDFAFAPEPERLPLRPDTPVQTTQTSGTETETYSPPMKMDDHIDPPESVSPP